MDCGSSPPSDIGKSLAAFMPHVRLARARQGGGCCLERRRSARAPEIYSTDDCADPIEMLRTDQRLLQQMRLGLVIAALCAARGKRRCARSGKYPASVCIGGAWGLPVRASAIPDRRGPETSLESRQSFRRSEERRVGKECR